MHEDRAAASIRKAEALARAQAAESRQAAVLVRQFVEDAAAAAVAPEQLTARAYRGSARYRTNVIGWYLKRDKSVGVGTDGEFYVLTTPGGWRARFTGVTMKPSPPPIELGKGGRDGESMPMSDALAKRLAGGNEWGN
jgi:hypothetical protein